MFGMFGKGVEITQDKRGGWLTTLPRRVRPPQTPVCKQIEARAEMTQARGERPLWEGYAKVENYPHTTRGGRASDEVRTKATTGQLYAWLVQARKPDAIVEFGTAFGVSGMYWLAGLEAVGKGKLFTFEPNADWASLADENLRSISDRYELTVDTFEATAERVLDGVKVDLAFVDAIHTGDFVRAQYAILKRHMRPGGLILFDDIAFSDDMASCWAQIAQGDEVIGSARLGRRVGVIEVS